MAISTSTTTPISRSSITIAALSTTVEWYDFTLFLYFATVLSRVFFGESDISLSLTLAGFAVSYLLRPLGAITFGYIGDYFGRRRIMLISMALMMITMLCTALLPTYQQIGASAGIFALILRGIMAFSVGGEYTGVVAYLLEGAAKNKRGLITSIAAAASEVGALLAVGIAALTVSFIDMSDLESWGWRIPFFIGAALAAILLVARAALQESPEFEYYQKFKAHSLGMKNVLKHHKMAIFRTFSISALGSITYYIGITYIPVFLVSADVFTEKIALQLSTIAAFAIILITPIAGLLSDRFGRKPVLLVLTIASIILPLILYSLMLTGNILLVIISIVLLALIAGGVSAVGAPFTAEQFPFEARLLGLALGATAATAVFGGFTPYIAQLLTGVTQLTLIPAIMIVVVAICVFPVFLRLPETNPREK